MLARLQGAMGLDDLIEQMVLLPEPALSAFDWAKSTKSVNLVVGYNSSPSSQVALDITMWIAHQTRLATQKQVTVQVVYVVDDHQSCKYSDIFSSEEDASSTSIHRFPLEFPSASTLTSATSVLTQPRPKVLAAHSRMKSLDLFERADGILWQARSLAAEWRGSFIAHLRFGCVSTELRKVVESEAAALLFLGCDSVSHPVVQKLGSKFPCSVLGIPTMLKTAGECDRSA
jgi:hypothetical protein